MIRLYNILFQFITHYVRKLFHVKHIASLENLSDYERIKKMHREIVAKKHKVARTLVPADRTLEIMLHNATNENATEASNDANVVLKILAKMLYENMNMRVKVSYFRKNNRWQAKLYDVHERGGKLIKLNVSKSYGTKLHIALCFALLKYKGEKHLAEAEVHAPTGAAMTRYLG